MPGRYTKRVFVYVFVLFLMSCAYVLQKAQLSLQKVQEEGNGILRAVSVLRNRSDNIAFQCRNYDDAITTTKSTYNDFFKQLHLQDILANVIFLPEYKLVFCLVPKAASSLISTALLRVMNFRRKATAKNDPQILLRSASRRLSTNQIEDVFGRAASFLVVRHPFTRLVSAYRDKLENRTRNKDGMYFYRTYGRKIREKYGKGESVEPSFSTFVDYVLAEGEESFDEHWRPITNLCGICEMSFKFVVKIESFREEMAALVAYLKTIRRLPTRFRLEEAVSPTTSAITKQYLALLTKSQVEGLYKKYFRDFRLFDYSPSKV